MKSDDNVSFWAFLSMQSVQSHRIWSQKLNGLMLFCCPLEMLNHFWTRGPAFPICKRHCKLCGWTCQYPANFNPYLTYLRELLWRSNGCNIKFSRVCKVLSHKSYHPSVNRFIIVFRFTDKRLLEEHNVPLAGEETDGEICRPRGYMPGRTGPT